MKKPRVIQEDHGTEWTLLGLGHGAEGWLEYIGSGLCLLEWWSYSLTCVSHRLQGQSAHYKEPGVCL